MSHKIKLRLSYDGADFAGWQRQKTARPTVQGELEKALSKMFDEPIVVTGSSRTDSGVHALNQVAHFYVSKDPSRYQVVRGINSLTPSGLVIREAWIAPDDFHAITSTVNKTYRYFIWNHRERNPFKRNYFTHIGRELNVSLLNRIIREVIGEFDFKSFQTRGSTPKTTVRTITEALWQKTGPHQIELVMEGSGFLKQMVRNIVGTTLDLCLQNQDPQKMREILFSQKRASALGTAPAHGLYLWAIQYPKSLDKKCLKL